MIYSIVGGILQGNLEQVKVASKNLENTDKLKIL
jgi:hypothetical protein